MSNLQSSKDTLNRSLKESNTRIADLETEISSLKAEKSKLEAKIEQGIKVLKAKEAEIVELEG